MIYKEATTGQGYERLNYWVAPRSWKAEARRLWCWVWGLVVVIGLEVIGGAVMLNILVRPVPATAEFSPIKELTLFLDGYIDKKNSLVIADAIVSATDELSLPLEQAALLLAAMVEQESDFRVDCVGDNGRAIGLMQWHYRTWGRIYAPGLGCADFFNPHNNVDVGAAILNRYHPKDNMWLAVARYHGDHRLSRYARSVENRYHRLLVLWTSREQ